MKSVVLFYLFSCKSILAGITIEELIEKLCSSSALEYFVEITEVFTCQKDCRWSDKFGLFVDAKGVRQASNVDELKIYRADNLLKKMDRAGKYLDLSRKYSDFISEMDPLVKMSVWLQEKAGEPSSSYWGRDYLIDKLKNLLGCYDSLGGVDIAISMTELNPQKKKTDVDVYIRKILDKPECVSAQELKQIATNKWLDNYQLALDGLGLPYDQKLRTSKCREEDEKRIQLQQLQNDKQMISSLLKDLSIEE